MLMSLLPGWRLVWSLYGRFWCRSSFEALRVWRWARGHVVEGHVVRPVSGSMTRGVSGDDRDRAAAISRCRRAMELGRRKPIGFPRPARSEDSGNLTGPASKRHAV